MGGRLWSGISKSPRRTSRRPTCWTSFRTRHNSWRTITSTSLRKRRARVADLLGVKHCPQTKAHLGRHRLPLAQKERRQKPFEGSRHQEKKERHHVRRRQQSACPSLLGCLEYGKRGDSPGDCCR